MTPGPLWSSPRPRRFWAADLRIGRTCDGGVDSIAAIFRKHEKLAFRRIYDSIHCFFVRLVAVRSAQGASFVMTAASFASKPPGVRACPYYCVGVWNVRRDGHFYLASGIVGLIIATFTTAMESAVLPELALLQAKEEEPVKSLMSIVFGHYLL